MPEPDVTDRLAAAMQALYAASPDDFMGLRTQAVSEAKAARDKDSAAAIGKLRKPSVAAWAVNLTAREAPDLVEELLDLGERMRDAQSRLDAATLTALRPERDRLVRAFVDAAVSTVADAGRSLSAAAQEEVRGTVIAALADATAATAVGSGQLARALSYSGFGEVDVSEAVGRTSGGSILTVLPGGSGRGARGRGVAGSGSTRADGEADEAEGDDTDDDGDDTGDDTGSHDAEAEAVAAQAALEQAEEALAAAEQEVSAARERAEETRERLAVVERQLVKAREADERALEAVTDAVRLRKQAEAARRTAQEAVDRVLAR